MPTSGQKVNILVVDDNEAQLTALEAILAPLGQRVVKANSGAAALRALLQGDFAVILLDVRMDGMSGLETAELIKSREKNRLVPIIFLTGMDSREEALMQRAYSMGAVDYILKPVQADMLRSKVSVFVDLHRQQQRIVSQERLLRDSDRRKLELEHARELIAERVRAEAELTRVNEELREREIALKEAISARSRFFAAMSHELRTPINAALGYISLLIDEVYGPLNKEQLEGVKRAEKATRHLLELVNDVLDISKIEAGKIDLELEEVRLPGLVKDLFTTVKPLADEHGSELKLKTVDEPSSIVSDPRRVRQILFNLLSNAIKFGEGKPIEVVIRPRTPGRDEGVIIDVIDHGVGIAPADQERIFQEFEQVDHGGKQKGTGLGLAVSRRLADLLGGSLTLESKPGEGSTFTVTLPAASEERKKAA